MLWRQKSCGSALSVKRPDSAGSKRLLLSHANKTELYTLSTLLAEHFFNGSKHQTRVIIVSGADAEFIDQTFANELGIKTSTTANDHMVTALDGHVLNKDNLETELVYLSLGGNHHEYLKFLL